MRIGLEIHIQLPTKSKLFCTCPTASSEEPNRNVCEICLGMPGSKPTLNKSAMDLAIIASKTLNCRLIDRTWFSRKTYFYPDLAKNFQITQFEAPVSVEGFLDIKDKRIHIWRIHVEEDPARSVHDMIPGQEASLLDYNRSGVPLIEIVTAPDMDNPSQAREFLRLMLNELRYVGVISKEEETKIRADANISVTDGERVEIKNITGLKNLERALDFEFRRQTKVSTAGIDIKRETRGFDEDRGVTTGLREKEEEKDYGYIFEPDLPFFNLKDIAEKLDFPSTATKKAEALSEKYNLKADEIKSLLLDSRTMGEFLEKIAERTDPQKALRWINTVVKAEYYRHPDTELDKISDEIQKVIEEESKSKISDVVAKSAIRRIFETGSAGELTEMDGSDEELSKIIAETILEEQEVLEDIKKYPNAINNLVGKIIKKTGGRYDPREILDAIKNELKID